VIQPGLREVVRVERFVDDGAVSAVLERAHHRGRDVARSGPHGDAEGCFGHAAIHSLTKGACARQKMPSFPRKRAKIKMEPRLRGDDDGYWFVIPATHATPHRAQSTRDKGSAIARPSARV